MLLEGTKESIISVGEFAHQFNPFENSFNLPVLIEENLLHGFGDVLNELILALYQVRGRSTHKGHVIFIGGGRFIYWLCKVPVETYCCSLRGGEKKGGGGGLGRMRRRAPFSAIRFLSSLAS